MDHGELDVVIGGRCDGGRLAGCGNTDDGKSADESHETLC
jgi:hypothetical protein